ncbi:ABC transporter permease [Halobacillus fulvus]|nr:ABC transporter permease [Halobacillus fulvus]
MRNSLKVAKWEYKRNIKNKSFLISLALTPILFILFATLPTLLSNTGNDDAATIYVHDEVNVLGELQDEAEPLGWNVQSAPVNQQAMMERVEDEENTAYLHITEEAVREGSVEVYTSDESDDLLQELSMIQGPIRTYQLSRLDLSEEQINAINKGINFIPAQSDPRESTSEGGTETSSADPLERLVPGIFAGIILFSILITGMMIFQSASQEKKDKVAESILSSITPNDLMQGKIIGYFGLGLTQVFVWSGFALPLMVWLLDDVPIIEYLFVPELALLVFIAILGYLLFAAIFVGIGATIEDVNASSNFQGIIMLLPFLPFFFIGPVLSDPEGIIATIGSYIPITAPALLLVRLSVLEAWPWVDISLAIVILLISVWLFMKLAGKVFQVGILMYGKNATPQEIWKWLRA